MASKDRLLIPRTDRASPKGFTSRPVSRISDTHEGRRSARSVKAQIVPFRVSCDGRLRMVLGTTRGQRN